MRQGVDTNVLVSAHVMEMPRHRAVLDFLEGRLARRDVTLVVTPSVLHEFVHVVTDARRVTPPIPMAQAVAIARLYLAKSNVECLAVDAGTLSDALALVERRGLGRGRLADALLASALLRAGVKQVITCNASDFDGIPGLLVVDPREPPGA